MKTCNNCKLDLSDECFGKKSNVCQVCDYILKNDISKIKTFDYHTLMQILDYIINKKCETLNEVADILNISLPSLMALLTSDLKITQKPLQIKCRCKYCDNERTVTLSVYNKSKNIFCSKECYWKYKKEFEPKGKDFWSYSKIKTHCKQCNIEFEVSKWKLDNRKDVFCSQSCYWDFRKIHYSGENHNQYGTKKSEEQKNKMREITINRYVNGDLKSMTQDSKPQKLITELLNNLNISNKREEVFKYYAIDNYLDVDNLAIEVMGDYFHASPLVYNVSNFNEMQTKAIRRDKSKHTYIKKYHKIDVLYIWETDIIDNIDLCKQLVLLYIENKGVLENYHSYNYYIDESDLKLRNNIIQSYY